MSAQEEQAWYYGSKDGERRGPVTIGELSELASRGEVGPKTLVWSYGYADWFPAEQIANQLMSARPAGPVPVAPPPVPAEKPVEAKEAAPVPTVEPAPKKVEPTLGEYPILPQDLAPDKPAEPAGPAIELKPRKGSFVFPRVVGWTIFFAAIAAGTLSVLIGTENPTWPAGAVLAGGFLLGLVSSLAAYRKERYQILDSRVLCHRGGLVSDQTTELEIRNITHVKLKLPWLRYKLYGVGNVIVETAGNAQPVVMRAIREPEKVYADLQERMKKNGYDLTRGQLFHEESPALIGIIGECIGLIGGTIGLCLFLLPNLMGLGLAIGESNLQTALPVAGGVVAVILIAAIIVRFLDLKRRTYRVYNDVVVYEEGFLTRENAIIPYENIADSNTKSSFYDRIFGLYDVQVSCQGSGADIKFRRLANGIALSAAIDQLVVLARQKVKPSAAKSSTAAHDRPRRVEPELVPLGEAMVAELRMHSGRTLVPLMLLFPLLPIWLAAFIQAIIRIGSTRYSVRPGSVRHSYRFLTLHDREFAHDKITGLVVKRNLWDRMFGTLTLKFWSIGSGQPIEFAHISASQLDFTALMRQVGIPSSTDTPYQAETSFGLFTWLRAQLKFLPFTLLFIGGLVYAAMMIDPQFNQANGLPPEIDLRLWLLYATGLPVAIALIAVIRSAIYHSNQRLSFHAHYVEAEQGIIAKRYYYARYGNIKRVKVTRYPGGATGDLQIFVAGEEAIQQAAQKNQGQKGLMKQCSFTSGFLSKADKQGLLLDDILCGRVDPRPEALPAKVLPTLLEARRSAGNAIFSLIFLSILLVPLVVLLPITLPLTVMRVKRWRYRIETARIVKSWGMLYRSEESTLLDRVDSLQQSQGMVNKIFKNGNVTIMTAGSSKPDLHIIDSPDFLAIYQMIRERSE
ncbi:PH domain-containing protein [Luteolibacter flavescens]|uniref:PH domain-containing protein n=1 Tax=Luteolibacter flavescens TaxID=1859460 RepID=A0ABT3FL15_9BACT|nr:PH domain-containing protein [Luteolibacter flavescens]MCW1883879.1 PH domain-containing protein [Luteolibacter flavescens]